MFGKYFYIYILHKYCLRKQRILYLPSAHFLCYNAGSRVTAVPFLFSDTSTHLVQWEHGSPQFLFVPDRSCVNLANAMMVKLVNCRLA